VGPRPVRLSRSPCPDPTASCLEEADVPFFPPSRSCFAITHAHLDHIAGLIISSAACRPPPRPVYGIKRTIANIERLMDGGVWPMLGGWDDSVTIGRAYHYKKCVESLAPPLPDPRPNPSSLAASRPSRARSCPSPPRSRSTPSPSRTAPTRPPFTSTARARSCSSRKPSALRLQQVAQKESATTRRRSSCARSRAGASSCSLATSSRVRPLPQARLACVADPS